MIRELENLQNKTTDDALKEEFIDLTNTKNDKVCWKHVLRQVLISSGVWANFFTLGLCLGAPTVIVPQLRRDANTTDVVSDDMLSWLSSSSSYSGMLQVIILTILPSCLGRKYCFLLVSVVAMGGFVLLYVSTTVIQILISTIVHGILSASHISTSIMIITEYSSPQYRGIFLTMKSASFLWGIWISNIIGTFFHWKYIALVGIVTTSYILLTILVWPESPLWLASKKRYGECATAHYWLKGDSLISRRELTDLITFYKGNPSFKPDNGKSTRNYDEIWKKGFYKPLLLTILVNLLYNSLGKMTCTIYAFDILNKITKSESAAYTGLLILDGVTLVGAYIGSGVSKIVKRRPFMLVTTVVGIIFLYLLSLFMYLVHLNIVADNIYISLVLLALYSLAVSSGPLIMSSSLISEFIPVTHRNAFTLTIGMFGNFCFATFLKVTPYLFSLWGFAGLFLFYAVLSSILVILLYILLPETKNKTLVEIQKLITKGNAC